MARGFRQADISCDVCHCGFAAAVCVGTFHATDAYASQRVVLTKKYRTAVASPTWACECLRHYMKFMMRFSPLLLFILLPHVYTLEYHRLGCFRKLAVPSDP